MGTTPHERANSVFELLRFVLLMALIVIPIRLFIAQPFIVHGASMDPTFATGEYLIVDEITYRLKPPGRGDVVVFKAERGGRYLIKRVIGLPGEVITILGGTITIQNVVNPDGFTIAEPYRGAMPGYTRQMVTLQENEYFVMGDNRLASFDSRVFGPLKKDRIVGRALLRLFPFRRAEFLPGAYQL